MVEPKRYKEIKKRVSQGLDVEDINYALEQAHEDIKYLFDQINIYRRKGKEQ